MGWIEAGAAAAGVLALAFRNRGLMPFWGPHIRFYEPKQRALIAWNGAEELLVLATELRASEPTQVLEVMPLPSEPQVKKAHRRLIPKMWNAYQYAVGPGAQDTGAKGLTRGASLGADLAAGTITQRERIGAHDISVAKVLDQTGFVAWVEEYLRQAGVEEPDLSPEMEAIIGRYMARGYRWFVFDAVELGTELRENDAIEYRFRTDKLYYPLEVTSTGEGETEIELLILTPEPLCYFPELPHYRVRLQNRIIEMPQSRLSALDRGLAEFMAQDAVFRIWEIQGPLASFRQDLIGTNDLPAWRRLLQKAVRR